MLNVERWKSRLTVIRAMGELFAVKNGIPCECSGLGTACEDCDFLEETCMAEAIQWLCEEYKGSEINWDSDIEWASVPIDTEVLIKLSEGDEWIPAYFALYMPQKMMPYVVFTGGDKRDTSISISSWRYCRLANPEDVEKYRKKIEV